MNARRVVLSFALLAAMGCQKSATPAAPHAAAPEPTKAMAPALEAAATPTPVDAPVVASPTQAPAADGGRPHVSIDMRSGPQLTPGLPSVGDATSFRMTLRTPDGQFLSDVDPILGGKAVAVVARADLGWSTVLRADAFSDKARGTHDFRMVFPYAGIHRMWFIFSYHGKIISEEMVFSVLGKAYVGKELPESETTWKGEGGLTARLLVEPKVPNTCEPFLVATAWTKNDKPTRMTGAPDAATTWYVAIDGSLGEVVTGAAEPEAKPLPGGSTETTAIKLGGDLGTVAGLQLSRPGRYRVLAVATPPGAKPGQPGSTVVAPFVITVQGALHEGGCSK